MRMKRYHIAAAVIVFLCAGTVQAGITFENEQGQYLKAGGRVQLQYHRTDPDAGDSTDELRFRRLRPYIEGSMHEDWKAKFQWDMGKSDIEVKDMYFAYSGWAWGDVQLGNAPFPFSREFLTSSKKQQLVERTFVGDHNYGTPDRQAGLHLSGKAADGMITWGVAAAKGAIDPDNAKLDFDTTVALNADDDWSEGDMAGARVDVHPFGHLPMSQGDFDRDFKMAAGIAAFAWRNDDDNLGSDFVETPTGTIEREIGSQDVDRVDGLELSAALRGGGFSLDAEYNVFDAELSVGGISDGLYKDSETTLENMAIEGGYMLWPSHLELVGGYQWQDADNYADAWERMSGGINCFVKGHDIKYQVTYRFGENEDGVKGKDVEELFVQAQYVF